jgi:cyclic peptide transporter
VIEPLGGILLLAMVIGIVIFFFYRNKSIERSFNVVRDLQDSYFAYLDDLLAGFKEIKMGISRNDNLFFKFLDKNRLQTKDLVISNQYKYVNNDLVGNYSLYLVIGFILFGLPLLQPSTPSNITTFVIAILYAIGPVTMLINFIPTYTRVKISVERLNEFDKKLQALKMINIKHGVPITNRAPLESIRFENVTYHYLDKNGDPGFALKPMNLEIKTGELIFVTGGNGSGKTTFSNLLTGIYKPTSGKIFYNNQEVTENHAAHYRDSFSAIFTNNHLFSENYDDFDLNKVNQNFSEYLDVMQLASIISWDKKRNKIDHRLSKGQGKRMAMIYAQLENRQLWMLDEWAADQDPEFRKYFYTVFLQNLKKEGKTVIVITHDDRYFHLAERIIKFDFGKIVQDTILTPAIAEVTI